MYVSMCVCVYTITIYVYIERRVYMKACVCVYMDIRINEYTDMYTHMYV